MTAPPAMYDSSPITHHPSPITHHPSPITHHPSPITHHPSPITHHPSPITHHPSPITHHRLSIADDGISSSISTVLIVALVVVLVVTSAAAVMGFAAPPIQAPVLGISIDMKDDTILVSHLNGAVLPAGMYAVLIDGVDKTPDFVPAGNFGPGTILTSSSMTGAVGTVSVISREGGQSTLLAQKTFNRGSGRDLKIIMIGGEEYTLYSYKGTLQQLIASAKPGESITLQQGVYSDDKGENYWFSLEGIVNSKDLENLLKSPGDTGELILIDTTRIYGADECPIGGVHELLAHICVVSEISGSGRMSYDIAPHN